MRQVRILRLTVVALVMLACEGVSPAAIEVLDSAFGQGTLVRDVNAGNEWLRVDETLNRSAAEISAMFGDGLEFAGFQYATAAELEEFFVNLGLDPSGRSVGDAGSDATTAISLIGSSGYPDGTGAIFNDSGTFKTAAIYLDYSTLPPHSAWTIGEVTVPPSGRSEIFGSWLVRESGGGGGSDLVPEPAGIAVWSGLLAAGLGVALVRKRRWNAMTSAPDVC